MGPIWNPVALPIWIPYGYPHGTHMGPIYIAIAGFFFNSLKKIGVFINF